MANPSLMYEHCLTPLKGWFDVQGQLDYTAKMSANVTVDIPGGRVVHLNSVGEFETGCDGHQMPIFLLQGTDSQDVANPGTTDAGNFVHQAVVPVGTMSGLVASGGFELASTEFEDVSYARNDLLGATVANTNATTGGRITNQSITAGGDCVCGVVSSGVVENEHGIDELHFWSYFLPIIP